MSYYELTNIASISSIAASELASKPFVKDEIFHRIEDKRVRLTNLSKALTFGTSSAKGKTSLVFDTIQGRVRTEALVIGFDKDNVWLEGNIVVPVCALRSVDFI